ncbi:MAG TPA: GNAT family N-acetyltransferase [Acidimicrobiales bacterium]|nr:GNAT family N-acetyltransferase [Acidimicrobiales bacterium]
MEFSTTDDIAKALAWSVELFGDANPIALTLAPMRFDSATRNDDSLAVTLSGEGSIGVTMGPHPPLDPRWTHCIIDGGLVGDQLGSLTARDEWDCYTLRTFASEGPPAAHAVTDDELVTRFLDEHAPQSQVWPGNHEIVHWYAVRDEHAAVVSLAAVVRWESGYHVVSSVATVRELRGRGYATALMRGIIHEVHGEGVEWLALGVHHSNEPAQHVYRNVGFVLRAQFTTYATD